MSGLLSIILDKGWFTMIGPSVKIPMYIILGSSVCFALIFTSIDIINYVGGHIKRTSSKSLIDMPSQVDPK